MCDVAEVAVEVAVEVAAPSQGGNICRGWLKWPLASIKPITITFRDVPKASRDE